MKITKRFQALTPSVVLIHVCSLLVVLPTATAQQVDIIPFGATWDYLFTSIDDGAGVLRPADPFSANNVDFSNWSSVGFQTTTLTFDDGRSAPWQSGPALFGQGDANVVYGTEFSQPAANNRNVTQYFRHEFTTNQDFVNLTMSLIVDDGAVVYLDGEPVSSMMSCCRDSNNNDYDVSNPNDARFGTNPGYRDRSTVTNGPPAGSAEGFIYTERSLFLVDLGRLPQGSHVIGIETHQASTNSSDSRLDFRFFQAVRGDFDGDGDVDGDDVDALVGEIVAGTNGSVFDLLANGVVNTADLGEWLSDAAAINGFAAPFLLGDANLDGTVNALDLNALGQNWLASPNTWQLGDFTANGIVDVSDLNKIGLNWLAEIPSAASQTTAVPEPGAVTLAIFTLAAVTCLRRRTLGT